MKNDKYRVVFMGTPMFSVPILENLIKNYNVVLVVTQPDKEVGRKRVLTPSPVKQVAIENKIDVLTPIKIKYEYEDIINYKPDIIITCAYGQIIPKELLDYPKYGCINVHGSLLPQYRGGAPIQKAIIDGNIETGITIMYMDEGMDTGDMIDKKKIIIEKDDTYDTLSEKLSVVGTELLINTLPKIFSKDIVRIKQNDEEATYAKIIKRQDEWINFNDKSINIYNKIRALNSNPGAYALLNGISVKIYNSRINDNIYATKKNGEIVRLYKDGIGISTEDSEIIITDIKIEGKKRMLVKDYFNGINKEELIGKVFNEV